MRVPGWETLLAVEIDAARQQPFAWGQHDCAGWALRVREVLSGQSATVWPGGYTTAAGAERAMRRRGWADYAQGAEAVLGAPLARVVLAQRGDIVLHDRSFGVCVGSEAAFVGLEGLDFRPVAACDKAWRV